MSIRLAGPARFAIAAVSIVLGAAACGSDDPEAERSDPVVETSSPDTITSGVDSSTTPATPAGSTTIASVNPGGTPTTTTSDSGTSNSATSDITTSDNGTSDSATTVVVSEPGVSEADVIELEQQLDEIDRVLADLEAQLAQD